MLNRTANRRSTPSTGIVLDNGPANRRSVWNVGLLAAMLLAVAGCPGPQPPIATGPVAQPLTPLPVEEAVSQINNQMKRINGGLQAEGGFAKGYFTDADGKRRTFNHDAALLVLPPRYLRFDMKVLGKSVMLLGSNATRYWLATKMDDDALWWGSHNRAGSLSIRGVTLQPATMIEAVGVGAIPADPLPVQRVTRDHQQLIVTGTAPDGSSFIEKEYWLSRHAGRNLVRILMRAPDGEVAMDANLSNHEPLEERGPSIPRRIEIDWPSADGKLVFTCRSWKIQPRLTRAFAGFAFPPDRGEQFERIVDIDREYGTPIRTRRPGPPGIDRPTARRAQGPPNGPDREYESQSTDRPPPRPYNQTAAQGRRPGADPETDRGSETYLRSDAGYERRPDYRDEPDDRGDRRYGSDPSTASDTDPRRTPPQSRPPTRQQQPTERPAPQPQRRERQPDSHDDESKRPEKPKDPNVWWEPDQS